MARAHFHVFYTEGNWDIGADQERSGRYTTWGEAIAAVIDTGHRSAKHDDAMSQDENDAWPEDQQARLRRARHR
jgi:hypothetical protein